MITASTPAARDRAISSHSASTVSVRRFATSTGGVVNSLRYSSSGGRPAGRISLS